MKRTRIGILIGLLLILVAAGLVVNAPGLGQRVLVELDLATPAAQGYVVSGFLEAPTTRLAFAQAGRVAELLVEEGQWVSAGDALARLEGAALEAQRNAAQAKLQAAQARLKGLQELPRAEDLALARAAEEEAQTAYDAAQARLARLEQQAPAAAEAELAQARAELEAARAGLEAAQAARREVQGGAGEATLAAAQAAVAQAAAELQAAQAQVDRLELWAPMDGLLLTWSVRRGELVLPGWPVGELADLHTLRARVYLPEAELGRAAVGDQVWLMVDGMPEREFSGRVQRIATEAEFTPRNVQTPEERTILAYEVIIQVPNPQALLKPGLPVDVRFGGGQ